MKTTFKTPKLKTTNLADVPVGTIFSLAREEKDGYGHPEVYLMCLRNGHKEYLCLTKNELLGNRFNPDTPVILYDAELILVKKNEEN